MYVFHLLANRFFAYLIHPPAVTKPTRMSKEGDSVEEAPQLLEKLKLALEREVSIEPLSIANYHLV